MFLLVVMTSLKKILENSLFYSFTTVLLRASSIIFFPIFSYYLTAEDYGILNVTQGLVQIFSVVASLGLLSAMTRFVYTYSASKGNSDDQIISSVVSLTIPANLVVCIGVIMLDSSVSKFFLNQIPFYPFMFIYVLTIPFNSLIEIYKYYLVSKHEGKKTMWLNLYFFVTQVVINVILVAGFKLHVMGIIYGILINSVIFSIYAWYVFFRKVQWQLNQDLMQKLIAFSLPLLPFALLNMLLTNVDRLMLNNRSDTEAGGMYYIAITFSSVFSTIKESVVLAVTPWLYETMEVKPDVVRKALVLIFMGVSIAAVGVSWFSKEVLMILSSKQIFVEAYMYIPIGVLAFYIIHLGQLFSIKTFYLGNYSKYLWVTTAVGIAINYVAGYFLIPEYNIYGAIFAKLIGYIALVATAIYLSNLDAKLKNIYDVKSLAIVLAATSLLIVMPYLQFDFWVMLLLKVVAYLVLTVTFFVYVARHYDLTGYLKKLWPNQFF